MALRYPRLTQSGPISRAAGPTTVMTTTSCERRLSRAAIAAPSVRRDHWLLPAQDRVTLPELGLVDARSLAVLAEVEPPALPKDRYRVLPYDRLDVSLGDPGAFGGYQRTPRCTRLT